MVLIKWSGDGWALSIRRSVLSLLFLVLLRATRENKSTSWFFYHSTLSTRDYSLHLHSGNFPETGTGGWGFVVRDLDGEVMQRLEELTVWWMRYKQKWWHAQPP